MTNENVKLDLANYYSEKHFKEGTCAVTSEFPKAAGFAYLKLDIGLLKRKSLQQNLTELSASANYESMRRQIMIVLITLLVMVKTVAKSFSNCHTTLLL